VPQHGSQRRRRRLAPRVPRHRRGVPPLRRRRRRPHQPRGSRARRRTAPQQEGQEMMNHRRSLLPIALMLLFVVTLVAQTPPSVDDESPAIDTESVLLTLADGALSVLAVACSADGNSVAIATDDKTILVREVAGGTLRKLTGHEEPATALAFAPDGKTLASG